MKNTKKFIAMVLVVIVLASIVIVPASAADAANTNTSVTYLPVFEDFFNIESIFDFIARIFSLLGMTVNI